MIVVLVSAVILPVIVVAAGVFLVKGWLWSLSWQWHWHAHLLSSFSPFPAASIRSFSIKFRFGHMLPWRKSSMNSYVVQSPIPPPPPGCSYSSISELTEVDLKQFISYIDETDGGLPWQLVMERSSPTLAYQAWSRDPPQSGPTQYRTRTIFQNAPAELVRDFFWDDEFRPKWDDTLIYFNILNACPQTGTMLVHWIRKLPFLRSDREYVIVRRIWESRSTYYCITKGTEYPSLPMSRHKKTKRVYLYYSSWLVKPVESRVETAATEVILFHYEDSGLPKKLVKTGVRRAMWGLVKRLDAGIQAYKSAQASGVFPSTYALMARTSTKTSFLPSPVNLPRFRSGVNDNYNCRQNERITFKWLVLGGILIALILNLGRQAKHF